MHLSLFIVEQPIAHKPTTQYPNIPVNFTPTGISLTNACAQDHTLYLNIVVSPLSNYALIVFKLQISISRDCRQEKITLRALKFANQKCMIGIVLADVQLHGSGQINPVTVTQANSKFVRCQPILKLDASWDKHTNRYRIYVFTSAIHAQA